MADLTERLDEIIRRVAVVLNDENSHDLSPQSEAGRRAKSPSMIHAAPLAK
jgi:hypothetical protein